MKVSEAVIKMLEHKNVKYVFGIPGAHILSLYDELSRSNIKSIQVTQEQSAGFMADGYARIAHEPGIILTTAGPGVLNVINSIAQAYVESSGVFLIGANCKQNLWGRGCYHELKTPDVQINILKEITKYSGRVIEGVEVWSTMSRAFDLCYSGRPRPVYVEFPEDVFEADAGELLLFESNKGLPEISPIEVESVLELLSKSKKPLIIAGGGVVIAQAQEELINFAQKLSIPVTTTIMGKSSCPSSFSYNFGFCGPFFSNSATISKVLDADLIIALGTRFDELATGFFSLKLNGKLIHIDIDSSELNKNYKCDLSVVSDVKIFLSKINQEIDKRGVFNYKKECSPNEGNLNYKSPLTNTRFVSPEVFLDKVQKRLLGKKSIFVGDAGNSSSWLVGMEVDKDQIIVTPSGYNSMGFSVPAAIGAKLASPESKVLCICGDGSFLMTGLEVLTAIANNISIICVVLHDKRYNMLTLFQDKKYSGRYSGTLINTFNFSDFINANGGLGILINDNSEIDAALDRALSYKGVTLIEVMVDSGLVPPVLSKLKN